jgi:hypothetical protein
MPGILLAIFFAGINRINRIKTSGKIILFILSKIISEERLDE